MIKATAQRDVVYKGRKSQERWRSGLNHIQLSQQEIVSPVKPTVTDLFLNLSIWCLCLHLTEVTNTLCVWMTVLGQYQFISTIMELYQLNYSTSKSEPFCTVLCWCCSLITALHCKYFPPHESEN